MQVFETFNDTKEERLYLWGREILSGPDKLIEGFIIAEFQENINVLLVLKVVVELDDVLVMQCLVKSYLVQQLKIICFLLSAWSFVKSTPTCR